MNFEFYFPSLLFLIIRNYLKFFILFFNLILKIFVDQKIILIIFLFLLVINFFIIWITRINRRVLTFVILFFLIFLILIIHSRIFQRNWRWIPNRNERSSAYLLRKIPSELLLFTSLNWICFGFIFNYF